MIFPPHITDKQLAIQTLIYRFRFLNRQQIQTILKHKDYRRINAWLKDLTEKKCLERIYVHTMPENTKPAIYYLGKNGRKWMSGDDQYMGIEELGMSQYHDEQLKKTYKDGQRTEAFRLDCLAIADCYIAIEKSVAEEKRLLYLQTHSEYYGDFQLEDLKPDLSFTSMPGGDDIEDERSYFLFYITNRKPKRFIRFRIAHVINYFQNDEELDLDPSLVPTPTLLFIGANIPMRNYAKRVLERKLVGFEDLRLKYKCTTLEEFKTYGLDGDIWKKPKKEEY